jgi:hypothetical protein
VCAAASAAISASATSAKARARWARGQPGARRASAGPQPLAGDRADRDRLDRRVREDRGHRADCRGAVTCVYVCVGGEGEGGGGGRGGGMSLQGVGMVFMIGAGPGYH